MIKVFLILLAAAPVFGASLERAHVEAWRNLQRLQNPPGGATRLAGDRDLLDILRRSDSVGERSAAAQGLMPYVMRSAEVRRALREILENSREETTLRLQAAKSLSMGGHDQSVSDALLALAANWRAPEELRAIAYKSMYRMSHRFDVARALKNGVSDASLETSLRRAAAWGSFLAARRADNRRTLLDVLGDSREDEALRIEAAKSLFGSTNLSDVRRALMRVAEDGREPSALRRAALLTFVRRTGTSDTRRRLQEFARRDGDALVRAAAVRALGGNVGADLAVYFHLDTVPPFQWRDPLEDQ